MNIIKIQYCCTKHSNNGHCANIALYKVLLRTRKNNSENAMKVISFRCEEHKNKGTNGMKIIEINQLEQSQKVNEINNFLYSLIGKTIRAKVHTAKGLEVKYVKPNHCAVMCFQPITKKWKYVYYNQIILNNTK